MEIEKLMDPFPTFFFLFPGLLSYPLPVHSLGGQASGLLVSKGLLGILGLDLVDGYRITYL